MASTGIDRRTGKVLRDWPHVLQSLEYIFTTRFGERVMRRYFGSNIPILLGRSLVPQTVIRFYSALAVALHQEPRLALIKITPTEVTRNGHASFMVEFSYRPRGHLGDFTIEGTRKVRIYSGAGARLEVEAA